MIHNIQVKLDSHIQDLGADLAADLTKLLESSRS